MSGQVVAVCGKGGVGKTTVSAMLARLLCEPPWSRSVLAVDADHAGGLALALGLRPGRTLNDIRLTMTSRLRSGETSTRAAPHALDYLLLDALVERGSLAFLAAGRPEERGCFCSLNSLLRQSIDALAAQFDVTIVDAEAGVEQVNRDVVSATDHLLLVTDTSAKGRRVAEAIRDVVVGASRGPALGLLVNRARSREEAEDVASKTSLPLLGWLPEEEVVRSFDAQERSFLELPDCAASRALRDVVRQGALLGERCGG